MHRSRLAALLGLLILALPAAHADESRTEEPRLVTVSGHGEIRVEPDQARVTLGVEAREPTLEAARAKVNRGVEGVLKLVRELGVPDRQVNSTRLSVQPEYEWLEKTRTRRLVAYAVSRSVSVDLRELEKLGALVERSLSLGANQTGDPVLDHSRRVELEREALGLAAKDAERNAIAMAGPLGVTVGPVRSLSATQDTPAPVPMFAMAVRSIAAAPVSDAPQTYQAGEMVFRAAVNASFDLLVAPRAAAPTSK